MSLRSALTYWLHCDEDGCNAASYEATEFSSMTDADAEADAVGYDWVCVPRPGEETLHFCVEHGYRRQCVDCGATSREPLPTVHGEPTCAGCAVTS